jgi:hypothetical protein
MQKEIKELANLMYSKMNDLYSFEECLKFSKIAIEGGYQFKKCFNIDHRVFSGRK